MTATSQVDRQSAKTGDGQENGEALLLPSCCPHCVKHRIQLIKVCRSVVRTSALKGVVPADKQILECTAACKMNTVNSHLTTHTHIR